MRNITVSVSDAQFRKARIWAAERDTSVSATVEYLLQNLPKVARAVSALLESELEAMGIPPSPPPPPISASPVETAPAIPQKTPRFLTAKL